MIYVSILIDRLIKITDICVTFNVPHTKIYLNMFYFLKFFNVYLFFERERDSVQAGEGKRERETQNLMQAPDSELSAQSLTRGSNSQTVRS